MTPDDDFDLDALKGAWDKATPRPDAATRAAHLRLAQDSFDRLQESLRPASSASDRSQEGLWAAARRMLDALTSRGALTAATAAATAGVLVLTPAGRDLWLRGPFDRPESAAATPPEPATPSPAPATVDASPKDSAPTEEAIASDAPVAGAEDGEASLDSVPDTAEADTDPSPAGRAAETAPGPDLAEAAPEPPGADTQRPVEGAAPMPSATMPGGAEGIAGAAPAVLPSPAPPREATSDTFALEAPAPSAAPAPIGELAEAGESEVAAGAPPSSAPVPAAPVLLGESGGIVAPDASAGGGHAAIAAPGAAETGAADASVAAPPAAPEAMLVPPSGPVAEAFSGEGPASPNVTAEEPVSTVSLDVGTGSYALVRQSILAGHLPPPDAVRIGEIVNAFSYDWPAPPPGEGPFRPTVSVMPTPWNPETRLVVVAIQGERPAVEDRPPLNLVFLIDTSEGMEEAGKLPLLKQSFRMLAERLRPGDEVAVVTYGGSGGVALPPTPASDRGTILAALKELAAGEPAEGQGGLGAAYEAAHAMAADGEVTRVILATDGDLDLGLGVSDPTALGDIIAREREAGVSLSVLGFGSSLDEAAMRTLARSGNGRATIVGSLPEAQSALMDELMGETLPIAQDVTAQVEWNPATVAEYRPIGHETRASRPEGLVDGRANGAEVLAGHSVVALFEVTPADSAAQQALPAPDRPQTMAGFGIVRLRWTAPGGTGSGLLELPVTGLEAAGPEARWAAAMAGWGQLLRGEAERLGSWGWDDAVALASESRGEDAFGQRAEAIRLMRLAASLAP